MSIATTATHSHLACRVVGGEASGGAVSGVVRVVAGRSGPLDFMMNAGPCEVDWLGLTGHRTSGRRHSQL